MTRLDTKLIHAGEPEPRFGDALVTPVFHSSTYASRDDEGYHDIRYLRLSNSPNHLALHAKLAALEGADAALVTSSGMSAISTTLLALLRPGDHVIAQRGLYGGTHALMVEDLGSLGIETTFVDGDDRSAWEAALVRNTRVVYCEALTNPTLALGDLEGFADFAREHALVSIIDSTFTSPVNLRPVSLGFDVVVHSATKYLGGHSDLVAGAVVGRSAIVERIKRKLDHLGGSLDPGACYLLHRGLKTLGIRVRRQNESALALAQFLAGHAAVAAVNYPGLPSHPQHERASRLLDGCSGMLSFELAGGAPAATALCGALRLGTSAPSLGGPETLVTMPAKTSHVGLPAATRRAMGIADGLVRVSVGLEDPADLLEDFAQALAR